VPGASSFLATKSGFSMRAARVLSAFLKMGLLGAAILFTVQNMSRTSLLSLDLWVVGVQLGEPQPLPYLLWTALALGLLMGLGWGMQGRRKSLRRIRQLEADRVRQELGKAPEAEPGDWT
jgi:hypothetical protein